MESNDHLFQLIKSLSQAEKRYFKLEASKYATNYNDNTYLKLYDNIEAQQNYDEKALKQSLKEDSKLLKRFASVKNYLYNLILKCLVQMHTEKNVYSELHFCLQQLATLYDRGFYKQAKKKLLHAKQLAADTQKMDYFLVINRWELKLAEFETNYGKSKNLILDLLNEKNEALDQMDEELKIELLYEEAGTQAYQVGVARTDDDKSFYLEYLNNNAFFKALSSKSVYAQSIAYALEDIVTFMAGLSPEKTLIITQNRIKVFEQTTPEVKKEHAYYYAAAVFAHLQILLSFQKFDEAYALLDELEKYWKDNANYWDGFTDNMFFMAFFYHSTKIPRTNGSFEKIAILGKKLKPELELRMYREDQDKAFYIVLLNMAYGYFVLKNFDESLFWVRNILNDNTNTIRPDFLGFVHIFHLMLQYEIGNKTILNYQVERAARFLSKKSKIYDFERTFLNFFKKIGQITKWDSEFEGLFVSLKVALEKMAATENNFEKRFINDFYLVEWVASKLFKTDYQQLIIEKLETDFDKLK